MDPIRGLSWLYLTTETGSFTEPGARPLWSSPSHSPISVPHRMVVTGAHVIPPSFHMSVGHSNTCHACIANTRTYSTMSLAWRNIVTLPERKASRMGEQEPTKETAKFSEFFPVLIIADCKKLIPTTFLSDPKEFPTPAAETLCHQSSLYMRAWNEPACLLPVHQAQCSKHFMAALEEQ